MKEKIGEKISTDSGICEIVEYNSCRDITVKFSNDYVVKSTYGDFIRKNIKNPFYPVVYKVGFSGKGIYNSVKNRKSRDCWTRMLERCYDEKFHLKQPTYKGCSVVTEWHNFQNFAKWFEENYIEGWVLDKDILIKDNKEYRPDTCCFVPREINNIFTKRQNKRGNYLIGVRKNYNKYICSFMKYGISFYGGSFNSEKLAYEKYKYEKELYIKEVANKWKNLINLEVFNALINYKIEMND